MTTSDPETAVQTGMEEVSSSTPPTFRVLAYLATRVAQAVLLVGSTLVLVPGASVDSLRTLGRVVLMVTALVFLLRPVLFMALIFIYLVTIGTLAIPVNALLVWLTGQFIPGFVVPLSPWLLAVGAISALTTMLSYAVLFSDAKSRSRLKSARLAASNTKALSELRPKAKPLLREVYERGALPTQIVWVPAASAASASLAKKSLAQRLDLVIRVVNGEPVSAVAAAAGISSDELERAVAACASSLSNSNTETTPT